jgi:hypothetical protein
MCGVEYDRVARLCHDWQRAHISYERVVSKSCPALAHQNSLVASRLDFGHGILNVPWGKELPLFDVDRLTGRPRRYEQVGLAAQTRRSLQNIDDLGDRCALLFLMHIGEHRQAACLAHFGENGHTRAQAYAALGTPR